MNFSTVLKLVAIYKGIPEADYKKYIDSYSHFEKEFAVDSIKSIKFDSRIQEAHRLNASSKSEISGPVNDIGEIKVVQYGVRDEEPNRYAFFSEAYADNLFIRVFDKENKLDKFLNHNKITVMREVKVGSARIVEYYSENSDAKRHAVYMPANYSIPEDDARKFEEEYSVQANAEQKTTVFD